MAMKGSHGDGAQLLRLKDSYQLHHLTGHVAPMEGPGTGIMGVHCKRCLDAFHHLCDDLGSSSVKYTHQIKLPAMKDEHARFKVWAGNIGAHRSGRVSLDHRPREATRTRKRVVNLLDDLENCQRLGRCTEWWQGPSMIGLIAMRI